MARTSLRLYIQGIQLIPNTVTEQLKIHPQTTYTIEQCKGSRKTASWMWKSAEEDAGLSVNQLLSKFNDSFADVREELLTLKNVDEMWLDFAIFKTVVPDEERSINFYLDETSLKILSRFGLVIEFTTYISE